METRGREEIKEEIREGEKGVRGQGFEKGTERGKKIKEGTKTRMGKVKREKKGQILGVNEGKK